MKEFLPWSVASLDIAKQKYIAGKMSILDIQLSGKCQYNCIYCDSPDRLKPCCIDFDHLLKLVDNAASRGRLFDWVFVCGLGEPLWAENKKNLLFILWMCEQYNMKCTIFTNGNQLDEEIFQYIDRGILYPLIKIDSFSPQLAAEIYGTSTGNALKTLNATERLFELYKSKKSKYYSAAASIVPTLMNQHELLSVVKKCVDNNVFPLLGQLEYAGKAIDSSKDLSLSKEELLNLKSEVEALFGQYIIPICPAVIAGIHITHSGQISVDKKSGLSCSWFWLETPDVKELCNVNDIDSFDEVDPMIIEYRNSVLDSMKAIVPTIEDHPFGGCGGNIRDLAIEYTKLQQILAQDMGITI